MHNSAVNRHIKGNKHLDHVDHALGRPTFPLAETYRNHFATSDEQSAREMLATGWWCDMGEYPGGGRCLSVNDAGRAALADHLKQNTETLGRLFNVSWRDYDGGEYGGVVYAKTRAAAKYSYWIRSLDDHLSFGEFAKLATARLASVPGVSETKGE